MRVTSAVDFPIDPLRNIITSIMIFASSVHTNSIGVRDACLPDFPVVRGGTGMAVCYGLLSAVLLLLVPLPSTV